MPVSFLVRIVFWIWFAAAVGVGYYRVLQQVPPVTTQAVVVVIALLLLLAYFRIPVLRSWVDSFSLGTLVLIHVTRFAGVYTLMLYQRGDLPRAYAMPGSVTDIIVAAMALPIAFAPLAEHARRRAIVIWNVIGFVSLLLTLLSAARVSLASPAELRVLTHLPLSLVSTFLMPLLLATHVILFHRTRQPGTDV